MSLSNVFNIAGSALTAQSMRLNLVASNIANAESTASSTGEPYRARHAVFTAVPVSANAPQVAGVRVTAVAEDTSPTASWWWTCPNPCRLPGSWAAAGSPRRRFAQFSPARWGVKPAARALTT